jgi:GTP-binding protein
VARLEEDVELILADIPGLIEGAHLGVGLGHEFLRHIQRTRVLIHLLDGLSEDPVLDYAQINSELALFDPDLRTKPQVIAFNKMDIPEVRDRWPTIERQLQDKGIGKEDRLIAISALTGENVESLLRMVARILVNLPQPFSPITVPVYRMATDPKAYCVSREPQGWKVTGDAIERAAAMTYWEHDQSVRRFQRILKALGIEDALRAAGVKDGDTVFIGDYELEWRD